MDNESTHTFKLYRIILVQLQILCGMLDGYQDPWTELG